MRMSDEPEREDDEGGPTGPDAGGRRGLLKKAAVGAATAGVVWTAPRIEGLSLRPDYAAAQSAVGATFDIAIDATHLLPTSTSSFRVPRPNPAPGLNSAALTLTLYALSPFYATTWRGELLGSAAGNNCNITGLDGSENFGYSFAPSLGSPPNYSSVPSFQAAERVGLLSSVNNSFGSSHVTVHVSCT